MLCDKDLLNLLTSDPTIVTPFPEAYRNKAFNAPEWNGKKSPIQASSIDLHAGKIFIPGKAAGKTGSEGYGAKNHSLKQGESVIVSTMEKLKLPNTYGGIVFPPSGDLSSRGILVSNLGHIDPGFEGHLRFTLINMGKEEFIICEGSCIATLLLFQTSQPVVNDWFDRNGKIGKAEPNQEEIDYLSPDFACLDQRMRKIADERMSSLRYLWWQIGMPLLLTTLSVILPIAILVYSETLGDLKKFNEKNEVLSEKVFSQQNEIVNLKGQLNELTNLQSKKLTNSKQ